MKYVAATDVGKKREKNEDYYLVKKMDDNSYIYIVADGLGGYSSGEVASKLACDHIIQYFEKKYLKNKDINVCDVLKQAVISANNEIYKLEKTDDKYKGMGTTVVIFCSINSKLYYTSIGDSRMYNITDGFLKMDQITEDDTYVNTLLKTNVINEEEALNHPQKHMLTKALGVFNKIDVDVYEVDENINGYLVICTDGVTNMLEEKEILNIFKKTKFELIPEKIIQSANEKGGVDNMTLVVIKL
ncbi:MAG: Stp1/IreP family PP2C-type Ser/Thr phosphatase [Clostridia bacterium]|nr:Stp1/IreP family PP2C-type Ser/Thr phosphatase [Clostridia bacterium]